MEEQKIGLKPQQSQSIPYSHSHERRDFAKFIQTVQRDRRSQDNKYIGRAKVESFMVFAAYVHSFDLLDLGHEKKVVQN